LTDEIPDVAAFQRIFGLRAKRAWKSISTSHRAVEQASLEDVQELGI
jgi:hypothetical protein